MKKYFARLNPMERRFVVGVGVVFFIAINVLMVFPHFSDWGKLQARIAKARSHVALFEKEIAQTPAVQVQVNALESEGATVPQEDQAIQFLRVIDTQAQQSGVGILTTSRPVTRTNLFFKEQIQSISVLAGERQLVNFLYSLGAGTSLIRVRGLSVRPDASRQQLNASITLVATYQIRTPVARQPATTPATATPAVKTPITPKGTNKTSVPVPSPTATMKPAAVKKPATGSLPPINVPQASKNKSTNAVPAGGLKK